MHAGELYFTQLERRSVFTHGCRPASYIPYVWLLSLAVTTIMSILNEQKILIFYDHFSLITKLIRLNIFNNVLQGLGFPTCASFLPCPYVATAAVASSWVHRLHLMNTLGHRPRSKPYYLPIKSPGSATPTTMYKKSELNLEDYTTNKTVFPTSVGEETVQMTHAEQTPDFISK